MRTPTLTIVALAALSSNVIVASPVPGSYNSNVYAVSSSPKPDAQTSSSPRLHPIIGTKMSREAAPDHSPSLYSFSKIGPRELLKKALDTLTSGGNAYSGPTGNVSGGSVSSEPDLTKREDDDNTMGGNAYTGNSGDVNGGDVVNKSNNMGMPTLFNDNSNNGGSGGASQSGSSSGGQGVTNSAGGNAHSGYSGDAKGGSVYNSGGMMNFNSNNAGDAGQTQTGDATGGNGN